MAVRPASSNRKFVEEIKPVQKKQDDHPPSNETLYANRHPFIKTHTQDDEDKRTLGVIDQKNMNHANLSALTTYVNTANQTQAEAYKPSKHIDLFV